MEHFLTTAGHVLLSLGATLLGNEAVVAAALALILVKVPSPLRPFAGAVLKALLERERQGLESRAKDAVADAVAAVEQLGGVGAAKKAAALEQIAKRVPQIAADDAAIRIEAEVKRMNDYKAQAEADFARVAKERLDKVLSSPPKVSPTVRNLPAVQLD